MNIRELEVFDALMNTGSVSEAAVIVNRTQPQATRLIASLESRVGFKLFDRVRKRLIVTPQAREYHAKVREILDGVSELDNFARRIRTNRDTNVRILCSPHLAAGLIPHALKTFMAQNLNCTVSIDVKSRLEMIAALTKQNYDLGVSVLPIEEPATQTRTFLRSNAVVAVPSGHRLASKAEIHVTDLVDEAIIASKPRTVLRMFLEREFDQIGAVPQVCIETTNSTFTGLLVEQGLGVAILEHYVARVFAERGVVIRPLVPDLTLEYAFLFPRSRSQSPLVSELATHIAAAAV